jgi:hypothetical protein
MEGDGNMKKNYYEILGMTKGYRFYWMLSISDSFHKNHPAIELLDDFKRTFNEDISLQIIRKGNYSDLNFSVYHIPVLSRRFGDLIRIYSESDIELLPVSIEKTDIPYGEFNILKIYRIIDCADMQNSKVHYYTNVNSKNKEKGIFFMKLKLDYSKIEDYHIFKLPDQEMIFVSAELKKAIEEKGFTGIKFKKV